MIPGRIAGSVIRKNVGISRTPRSSEASSIDRSKPRSRVRTMAAANAMPHTEWASTIEGTPSGSRIVE